MIRWYLIIKVKVKRVSHSLRGTISFKKDLKMSKIQCTKCEIRVIRTLKASSSMTKTVQLLTAAPGSLSLQ